MISGIRAGYPVSARNFARLSRPALRRVYARGALARATLVLIGPEFCATYGEAPVSEAPERLRAIGETADHEIAEDDFEFADYCARPMCRKEFRQAAGRGRRRDYCSETCRRLADRDYKRAKALVEHFEGLSRRSRHDVLAFGRAADDLGDGSVLTDDVALERASSGLARAKAVLQFAGGFDERLVAELDALCDAVAPVIGRLRIG